MDAALRDLVTAIMPGPEPGPALAVAVDHLVHHGFDVEDGLHEDGIVATRGAGGVVLSGHVDVVPAGSGWTHAPHEATFVDDRVYGRGSADMRGPVAAMLWAVATTDAPCRVVLTCDEETRMFAARHIAGTGVLDDAPLVVVGEPTSMRLAVAGKGVAWMAARVEGRSAHASTPDAGTSAARALLEALHPLPDVSWGPDHSLLGPATMVLTGLVSGDRYNVMPAEAEARFDARFPPPLTPNDAVRALARAVPLAEVRLDKEEPSFEAPAASVEAALQALGGLVDPVPVGVPFASEAGHWAPRAPCVILGPGTIEVAHSADEHVAVAELERAARAYERLVRGLAGRP